MSASEESMIKSKVRGNSPLDLWGSTNSTRYHTDRFHTYSNWPNNMESGVAELKNKEIQKCAQHISVVVGRGGTSVANNYGVRRTRMQYVTCLNR